MYNAPYDKDHARQSLMAFVAAVLELEHLGAMSTCICGVMKPTCIYLCASIYTRFLGGCNMQKWNIVRNIFEYDPYDCMAPKLPIRLPPSGIT